MNRRLLISGYDTTTQRPGLWIVPLNGAAPYLLRDAARDGSPSPDGTKVVFTQSNQSEIWTMELGSQPAQQSGRRQKYGYVPGRLMVVRQQAYHLSETTLFPPARVANRPI